MVVKNWPHDSRLNCTPDTALKDYMKVEYPLVEENYDLLNRLIFFNNWRLMTIK